MTVIAKYLDMKNIYHSKKADKLHVKNLKKLLLLKDKWKKQTTEWEKIFKSYIINIKYLYRIFKDILNNKTLSRFL